ncbi:MAG: hypothetical protein GX663_07360, partial [Clostridiales bacterium]|nr:hypothetical protein [Clostridiales bacterium]
MQTTKRNTIKNKLLTWLLALVMVVTLTPSFTGIASADTGDTKLVITYAGTEYKLTEGQWNTLLADSTARVTDQYYSQYSNKSTNNPSNIGPYSGVKFSSILSTLGILDDMSGNFVVKIGGSSSTISYADLTKTRYLYSQAGTPTTYDADAAGVEVQNIITDDGTFALGMDSTKSEKNAPYFRTDVFTSGITINNPAFELVEGDVTLDKDSYEYQGEAINPVVTVKHNNSALKVEYDYTLDITSNDKVGEGTVTVTGAGQFYGTVIKKFAILSPADTSWYNTNDDSFMISKESQLRGFAEIVNGTATGISQDSFAGKNVKLENDIALVAPWVAAGTDSKPFEGTFDGQKHSITGININSATGGFKGFFGKIGENGVVKNFNISGSIGSSGTFIKNGSDNLGGVAGWNDGKVKNVKGSVSIFVNTSSIYAVGGIVGQNGAKGTVSECQNTADVTATKASGGVVGRNFGTIDKCVNNGNITGNGGGKDGIGGIVGYGGNKSSTYQNHITNCYNTGATSNNGGRWQGGIAGFADSATHVENCYSIGTVVPGYSWNWNPIIGHVDSGYSGTWNNYSLEGLNAGDTTASTKPLTIGQVTSATDFKDLSMINKLGSEYVMDKSVGAAINNGYPVLLWQSGNDSVPENSTITTGGVYSVTEGGTITIETSEMVTLVGKGTGNDSSNTISGLMITYKSGVSANLMIRDLYIKSGTDTNTIDFNAAGNNLMLSGTNIIEGGAGGGGTKAVIHVSEAASLNLLGTGTLYLFKETGGAGIGGNSSENNGKITFESGNYFIKGSKQGAVIGTGANASKPGDITINDGNINIIGNARGASIGGAAGSSGATEGGKVYVNGGTVSVNVDFSGAAIGGGGYDGGNDSVGGELFVSGGSIRTYIDNNAMSSWAVTDFGVNDKAINATKLNNSTDKKDVVLLTFDTTKLNKKSGAADPARFSVAEGRRTIYSGALYTHKYVNQA